MSRPALIPQLIEMRTAAVGTLEHEHQIQSVGKLRSKPLPGLRPDLTSHEVDCTPEYLLFDETENYTGDGPQIPPEVPEEHVHERIPRSPEVRPQKSDLGLLLLYCTGFSLLVVTHVVTSLNHHDSEYLITDSSISQKLDILPYSWYSSPINRPKAVFKIANVFI